MSHSFKDVLRQARIDKGMSQEDLAYIGNYSRATIVKWELGEREPTLKNANDVLTLLGVSMVIGKGEADDNNS